MLYSISVAKNIIIMHNLDPKTVNFKPDMYMPFDRNQALWKAEMLRFHRSQHSRNFNTRGYGFDQRLLELSRQAALEYKLDCDYAELFEMRELKS
ncbi:MAG: hypothetical protein ACIAQZ_15560 [Sedimentisphaeraceae bacterium JB056]